MCSLEIGHNIEIIVAHKNSPLNQQEGETYCIPQDTCFILRQFTYLIIRWICAETIFTNLFF